MVQGNGVKRCSEAGDGGAVGSLRMGLGHSEESQSWIWGCRGVPVPRNGDLGQGSRIRECGFRGVLFLGISV